jgi:hypothetical protein
MLFLVRKPGYRRKLLKTTKEQSLIHIERLGHIHGEIWATNIKEVLKENNLWIVPTMLCSYVQRDEFHFCQ